MSCLCTLYIICFCSCPIFWTYPHILSDSDIYFLFRSIIVWNSHTCNIKDLYCLLVKTFPIKEALCIRIYLFSFNRELDFLVCLYLFISGNLFDIFHFWKREKETTRKKMYRKKKNKRKWTLFWWYIWEDYFLFLALQQHLKLYVSQSYLSLCFQEILY